MTIVFLVIVVKKCNNLSKNPKVLQKTAVIDIKEKSKRTKIYGNGSVTIKIIGTYSQNA